MTFELRPSCSEIYQMTSANDVELRLCMSSKVIHAGSLCRLEEIVDFVHFPRVAAEIWGKIAVNAIDGSLLDTLEPKHKKLVMN